MSQLPFLSLIIPTHNRSGILRDTLLALGRQSWPFNQFEVIVVADNCQDDTAEMVAAYQAQAPYRLRFLSHTAGNAAATRNLGAAQAQGQVLLFLDDDVGPQPDLVRAHGEAQAPHRVVLGYSKPILPENPSWWQMDARRWWEDTFREFKQPGHRFTYRDFFSGNVSLPTTLFQQIGGFDTALNRLEDYEFGLRLLKAGIRFHYEPLAVGHHYENTDLEKWLRRIRQEGAADVLMSRRHPELRPSLFGHLQEPVTRLHRLFRHLALYYPRHSEYLEPCLLGLAARLERLRQRYRWWQVITVLRAYNYWRGVSETIGERQALTTWLQTTPALPAVGPAAPIVDLAALPPETVLSEILAQGNQEGLRVVLAGVEALTLPPQFGAEPLRLEHLPYALRQKAKDDFSPALAFHLISSSKGKLSCLLNWPKSI